MTADQPSTVLVHGAWHGGWVWSKVVSLLAKRGLFVRAPTLSGLGSRAHLLKASTGLQTHVKDVVEYIQYWDLKKVKLVGHSYGGMVITGVLGLIPDRIQHAIYLDAFVPEPEESLFDLLPEQRRQRYEALIDCRNNVAVIPAEEVPDSIIGEFPKKKMEWIRSRLTDQPVKTFQEALSFNSHVDDVSKTYILCARGANDRPFVEFASVAVDRPGWRKLEIDSFHDVMLHKPLALARMLVETE